MRYTAPVTYAAYEVHGTGLRIGWDATDVRDQLQTLCAYFGLVAVPSESTQCAIILTWQMHGDPSLSRPTPVSWHSILGWRLGRWTGSSICATTWASFVSILEPVLVWGPS